MQLFFRVWIAATAIVALVTVLFVGLATLQFKQIYVGLVGERLAIVADNAAAPFRAAAQIGLPLSGVRSADALLEKARQSDGSISSVHLYDAQGQVLVSTDRPAPRQVDPEVWQVRGQSSLPTWYHEGPDWISAGQDVTSLSGTAAGGVIVVYSSTLTTTRVWAMAAELFVDSLWVILVATGLVGLVLRLGMSRAIKAFDETEGVLTEFDTQLRQALGSNSDDGPASDDPEALGSVLKAANQSYRAAAGKISSYKARGET